MPGLLTLEAANLFCGNGESNHLRLVNVKLPGIEEQYVDHRPGGAPVAIEVDVMINKLQCDFSLIGWDPVTLSMLDAWSMDRNKFWIYGALRQRPSVASGGTIIKAEAFMFGRLGKADPEAWARGGVQHWTYSIRGIIQYRLKIDNQAVFDWDFFQNTLQTGTTVNNPTL